MSKIIEFKQTNTDAQNPLFMLANIVNEAAYFIEKFAEASSEILKIVCDTIGLDSSNFKLYGDMERFHKQLFISEMILAEYYYQDKDTLYIITICESIEEEKVYVAAVKEENGREYEFDPETREWKMVGPNLSDNLKKILNSDSSEADILSEILESCEYISYKKYSAVKRAYEPLFRLYDETDLYMTPYCKQEGKRISLYLVPADPYHHGFMVGFAKEEFVLYQTLDEYDFDMFELDGEWEGEYCHEVGRTKDPKEIQRILYHMCSRWSDVDVFTIPLSMTAFTEDFNPWDLGKHIYYVVDNGLTAEEQSNLEKIKNKIQSYLHNGLPFAEQEDSDV